MFSVYVNKNNNKLKKEFIIPKNSGYNSSTWMLITITGKDEFLVQRFSNELSVNESEWELRNNYAFPSALLTEFLRLDFDDDSALSYLK
jgi:hypothetical protein